MRLFRTNNVSSRKFSELDILHYGRRGERGLRSAQNAAKNQPAPRKEIMSKLVATYTRGCAVFHSSLNRFLADSLFRSSTMDRGPLLPASFNDWPNIQTLSSTINSLSWIVFSSRTSKFEFLCLNSFATWVNLPLVCLVSTRMFALRGNLSK